MTTEPPPPGSGNSPDDDPFRKPPPSGGGSPYDPPPQGGGGGDPYGGNPYDNPPPPGDGPYGPAGGGGPYGGDPLAGMPPLAPSGKRVLARVIDMIIVGVVVWLLSMLFNVGTWDSDVDNIDAGKSFGQSLIAAILYIAYDTILTARTGQTVGKRLLHLRVADLSNGATPSTQTSLIRAVVLWLPFAFCCACIWTIICGGWSFFDRPYKQGLHDKAAKTVEVTTG
ncbi:RDD family protein [Streptomyces sp. GF20]|uniref:RDD family protein n=1 Tax=Streptomyces sp. GF20 TaxID=2692235 RepID=UPI001316ACD0|nr:RDD family protein [Streptomyces sp. GF20]QHC17719.1 RDD family protein [Streptomyces sp. GF20]